MIKIKKYDLYDNDIQYHPMYDCPEDHTCKESMEFEKKNNCKTERIIGYATVTNFNIFAIVFECNICFRKYYNHFRSRGFSKKDFIKEIEDYVGEKVTLEE